MPLVMNWKIPKDVPRTPVAVEQHLAEAGIQVTVTQIHCVRSGKWNTTFEGTEKDLQAVWEFIKRIEKLEIARRRSI